MTDFVWGTRKVSDLVQGSHIEEDGRGRHYLVDGFGWYEARCKAYDTGVPDVAHDAIQLDMALEQITDLPVKAALTLRMHGWDPLDIAAILKDRKHRPTPTLIDEGIERIVRYERNRKASCE